ncbi:hypothetical protein [Citricoccus sp. NR2]|nr:hypothetical protein [Citricoccus sp. NR2]WBL19346.1 hypothetical protein O1A05_01140 [Citricoccus sp. NR2]
MTTIRQARAAVVGDDHAFRIDTIELSVASGGQPVLVPSTG